MKQNYYKDLYSLTDNQKEWLPEVFYTDKQIKESISELFENHDLDTNEIWGRFKSDLEFQKLMTYQSSDSFYFNQKKLRKRLNNLNLNDINTNYFFSTKKFNIILYYVPKENLYFYYGIYK